MSAPFDKLTRLLERRNASVLYMANVVGAMVFVILLLGVGIAVVFKPEYLVFRPPHAQRTGDFIGLIVVTLLGGLRFRNMAAGILIGFAAFYVHEAEYTVVAVYAGTLDFNWSWLPFIATAAAILWVWSPSWRLLIYLGPYLGVITAWAYLGMPLSTEPALALSFGVNAIEAASWWSLTGGFAVELVREILEKARFRPLNTATVQKVPELHHGP